MRRVPREAPGGVRERPPVLTTAASRQAKHHPVYPGTRTVRGATRDRLGGAWRLTEDALLKSERLRFMCLSVTVMRWLFQMGALPMCFHSSSAGFKLSFQNSLRHSLAYLAVLGSLLRSLVFS